MVNGIAGKARDSAGRSHQEPQGMKDKASFRIAVIFIFKQPFASCGLGGPPSNIERHIMPGFSDKPSKMRVGTGFCKADDIRRGNNNLKDDNKQDQEIFFLV